jgi:hypothetical protein
MNEWRKLMTCILCGNLDDELQIVSLPCWRMLPLPGNVTPTARSANEFTTKLENRIVSLCREVELELKVDLAIR